MIPNSFQPNGFYGSIIIAKTVWNATLKFLRYGIENKMSVILQCALVTHHEYMSKLPFVSLFKILSAIFARYFWIGLQLGKLSQKIKRVNFLFRHSVDFRQLPASLHIDWHDWMSRIIVSIL